MPVRSSVSTLWRMWPLHCPAGRRGSDQARTRPSASRRPCLECLEERLLPTLSDAAYDLLIQRASANRAGFFVYQDADSGFNHGYPSGFFGNFGTIQIDAACIDDPAAPNGSSTDPNRLDTVHGTVFRYTFGPQAPGSFAGVNVEEPEHYGVQ